MIDNGLNPYPTLRPSGVPWLGDVPAHWQVRRLKWIASVNPSKSEARPSLTGDTLVTFLPMERVGTDGQINAEEQLAAALVWNGLTYFRRNDVIVAKITPCFENGKGAWLGRLPTEFGFGSTEFHVLRAGADILPRFLYLLTTVDKFRHLGVDAMTGAAGQQRVPESFIANYQAVLPPLPEQRAIVHYLDHVDRRIRRYIRAKQKLIKLLEEQKQAIIHRAVTRGLDPHVRLKPSGIEWLGDVPVHWEVLALKRLLRRLIDCEHKTAPSVDASRYRVVRTTGVRRGQLVLAGTYCTSDEAYAEWTRRGIPEPGDVIFTREAPVGEACIVPAEHILCLGQRTVLMKLRQEMYEPQFLVYMIYSGPPSHRIKLASQGSTVGHFNVDDIASMLVFAPPVSEQQAIIDHIKFETLPLETAQAKAAQEIALLREYRTRLIADVVTGKLDVRKAAAQLPEEETGPADAVDGGETDDPEADAAGPDAEPDDPAGDEDE